MNCTHCKNDTDTGCGLGLTAKNDAERCTCFDLADSETATQRECHTIEKQIEDVKHTLEQIEADQLALKVELSNIAQYLRATHAAAGCLTFPENSKPSTSLPAEKPAAAPSKWTEKQSGVFTLWQRKLGHGLRADMCGSNGVYWCSMLYEDRKELPLHNHKTAQSAMDECDDVIARIRGEI